MEYNKDYIRTQGGTLISALTGRRYNGWEEAQLFKDNQKHTEAANLSGHRLPANPLHPRSRSGRANLVTAVL